MMSEENKCKGIWTYSKKNPDNNDCLGEVFEDGLCRDHYYFDIFERDFGNEFDEEKQAWYFSIEMVENTVKLMDTWFKMNEGRVKDDYYKGFVDVRRYAVAHLASMKKDKRKGYYVS